MIPRDLADAMAACLPADPLAAWATGYLAGWERGERAGRLAENAAMRADDREALRLALCPTAPTLAAAIEVHSREVDRLERRRAADGQVAA